MFGSSVSKTIKFLQTFILGWIDKIKKSYGLGLLDLVASQAITLMTILEAIVLVYGEDLGKKGAFISFEGMGDLLWYFGGEAGVCLMYHHELGWAYYTYSCSLCGLMIAGGISVIAGFWTWHSEEKFTFDDWEGFFEGTVVTGGIGFISGSFVKFNNFGSTITGWGGGHWRWTWLWCRRA
ncbi:MAG: hypothetical protein HXS44_06110 [Theionarchaea archaeon]|nr:hypothetical protein [Theionarchaea archaeon]